MMLVAWWWWCVRRKMGWRKPGFRDVNKPPALAHCGKTRFFTSCELSFHRWPAHGMTRLKWFATELNSQVIRPAACLPCPHAHNADASTSLTLVSSPPEYQGKTAEKQPVGQILDSAFTCALVSSCSPLSTEPYVPNCKRSCAVRPSSSVQALSLNNSLPEEIQPVSSIICPSWSLSVVPLCRLSRLDVHTYQARIES